MDEDYGYEPYEDDYTTFETNEAINDMRGEGQDDAPEFMSVSDIRSHYPPMGRDEVIEELVNISQDSDLSSEEAQQYALETLYRLINDPEAVYAFNQAFFGR